MTSAGLVADKPVERCKEQHEGFSVAVLGKHFLASIATNYNLVSLWFHLLG